MKSVINIAKSNNPSCDFALTPIPSPVNGWGFRSKVIIAVWQGGD
jgi:hypothetical protein